MPDYFPAFLDLRGRRCLLVGGGASGERKLHDLLSCGARVVVVSPRVTPALRRLAETGAITLHARPFEASDVRGCVLVIAATGVERVDAAVAAAARRRQVLVNVVDRAGQCGFICGSVLRRGQLQIAVSTGGRSPLLAREIRRRLEGVFGPEWAEIVETVGAARTRLRVAAEIPGPAVCGGRARGRAGADRPPGAGPALAARDQGGGHTDVASGRRRPGAPVAIQSPTPAARASARHLAEAPPLQADRAPHRAPSA